MLNVQRLIPGICLIAGLLLIGSELLDTFVIENPEGVAVAAAGAADRHGFALGLLGLVAIAATLLAVFAGSRPAAISVAVCGIVALALFALIDLPDVGSHDLIADANQDYTEGRAVADSGFWISMAASILMIIGGTLLASLSRPQLNALRPGQRQLPANRRRPAGTPKSAALDDSDLSPDRDQPTDPARSDR